jgi:hypothetical protein
MGKLIRFPQERCQHSLDNYRPEGATILIMPIVPRNLALAYINAFAAMNSAFLDFNELLWFPPSG